MKNRFHLNFKERAAVLTFVSGIVFRLTSVVVAFLTVPILLNYFGVVVYGAFNTLIVLFFYLNQSGLGVTFSLQSEYPVLIKNETAMRSNYTAALFLNILIGLIIFGIAVAFSFSDLFAAKFSGVIYNSVLSVNLKTWRAALLIIVAIIAIELPLDIGVRFLNASHKKFITHFTLTVTCIVSFFLTVYFVKTDWNIAWIIFAQFGVSTFAFFFIFYSALQIPAHKFLRKIQLRDFKFSILKKLLNIGLKYSGIQLLTVLMFWSDNLFIANAYGFESVTKYALASKISTLLSMPSVVFVGATFPIFNETAIERNTMSLLKLRNKSLLLIALYSLIVLLFVYGAVNFFTQIWLQKTDYWNAQWKLIIAVQSIFYCFYIYCVEMLVSRPFIHRATRLFVPIMLIAFASKFFGLYYGGILGLVVLPTAILSVVYIIPALKMMGAER